MSNTTNFDDDTLKAESNKYSPKMKTKLRLKF